MSPAVRPAESKAMTDRSRLVEEDPIQYNIKQLATKTAIVFLRAIRVLKKGAERAFQYIAKYLTPVGSFFCARSWFLFIASSSWHDSDSAEP